MLNLTQHPATPDQIAQGVIDLPEAGRRFLAPMLTFGELPTKEQVQVRAEQIARFAAGALAEVLGGDPYPEPYDSQVVGLRALIGGAPFLMGPLEKALKKWGIIPCYSFSLRESVETTDPITNTVTKTAVFRHRGFVEA